jgi:hypothetical protein
VPDDDRNRRRVGDETKERIADLASGWDVPPPSKPAPEPPAAPAPEPPAADAPRRKKQKTLPPPPPGSAERKALEDAIVEHRTPVPTDTKTAAVEQSGARALAALGEEPAFNTEKPTNTSKVPSIVPKSSADLNETSGSFYSKDGGAARFPRAQRVAQALDPAPTGTPPSPAPTAAPPPALPPAATQQTGPQPAVQKGTGPQPAVQKGTGPQPAIGRQSGSHSSIPSRPTPGQIAAKAARMPLRADPTDKDPAAAVPARVTPASPAPVAPASPAPPPIPAAAKRAIPVEMHDEKTHVDDEPPGAMPKLAVPVGEFGDDAGTELEPAKLRIAYEQSTIKRDAASALLGIPEPPLTVVKQPPVEILLGETAAAIEQRGDPTGGETMPFERADPTRGDSTTISPPSEVVTTPGTKLRSSAALRRKRGIDGDVRYVLTVLFGVRRARRELEELEVRQTARLQSRRRALVTIGRAAIALESFDHPALGPAREQLASVEDERSRHSAQVIAADEELQRVKRDRADKAKQHTAEIAAIDTELAESAKKLEKLEKEAAAINKKATELRDTLRRIEGKISTTEASMGSLKAQQVEKATLEAELASLRADRQGVLRDEPKIASELDAISPRIAGLEARRSELRSKRASVEKAEREDQSRSEDLLAAIGAKRKVVDRASADAETLRDKILFELGERLYVDRPAALAAELSPADAIDVELGTSDRRVMELREIMSSVDKAKLARGIAVLVLALAAIGALVWWLIYLRTS